MYRKTLPLRTSKEEGFNEDFVNGAGDEKGTERRERGFGAASRGTAVRVLHLFRVISIHFQWRETMTVLDSRLRGGKA